MKTFQLILLLLPFSIVCSQEKVPEKNQQVEEQKVKIPSTLAEAHSELERLLPKKELKKIDAMKSEEEMGEYHFGMGMNIRNSWGLWGESKLFHHMKSLGFTHPDDMSSVILATFWCKRHGKDLRMKERANYYKAYWKENKWPSSNLVDPKDKSEIRWKFAFEATGRPHRMIYMGKSIKTGRWLAFENPTGIYVPDKKLIQRIEE